MKVVKKLVEALRCASDHEGICKVRGCPYKVERKCEAMGRSAKMVVCDFDRLDKDAADVIEELMGNVR